MKIIRYHHLGLDVTVGIPADDLKSVVHFYLQMRGNADFQSLRILPRCTSEIIFNLKDPLLGMSGSNKEEISFQYYLCSGIRSTYFDSVLTGNIDFVVVRLCPTGWNRMFEIPPYKLTNHNVELDSILGRTESDLMCERLSEYSHSADIFELLQQWIRNRLREEYRNGTDLSNFILKRPSSTIKELESMTGYSRQYLHRIFKSITGLSIKDYQQLARFFTVLTILQDSDNMWADVAFKAGYSDQSHFIKLFKRFTGYTPAEYVDVSGNKQIEPTVV